MRRALQATVVTFVLTWLMMLFFYFAGDLDPVVWLGLLWIPGLVAVVFAWVDGVPLKIFRRPDRTYLCAALEGIALVVLAISFGGYIAVQTLGSDLLELGGSHFSAVIFQTIPVVIPPEIRGLEELYFTGITILVATVFVFINGTTVRMIFTLGQELMWRGYLWEKLKTLGKGKASLLIGLISGLWYAPITVVLAYPYLEHPLFVFMLTVATAVALSPILTDFRIRGEAIMAPAAFHASASAAAGVVFALLQGASLPAIAVAYSAAVGLVAIVGYLHWRTPDFLLTKNDFIC